MTRTTYFPGGGTSGLPVLASFRVVRCRIGFDNSNRPVLASSGGTIYTSSASGGPSQIATNVPLPDVPRFPEYPTAAVGDAYGLWIGGTDGIYLYKNGSMGKVSNIVALPDTGCI